ncbi:MAG TPA: hypothetical protein VI299_26860 [Polyangiales bacterium]
MKRLLALLALTGCTHAVTPVLVPKTPSALGNDSLELHYRALALGLADDGLKQREGALLERGFLPPSGRVAFPVHIAASECAMFVALATASMADLDASLYTAEGAALIEDDSTGSRPALTFCASAAHAVDAYFTLHAYQGAGAFVVAQFTRPLRADDDLRTANGELMTTALGELAQTLHDRGFEDAAPRVSLPLGDARPVRMAVNVAAGECYTLAAEGGEGVAELGLRLVDAEGGELALGVGEAQPGHAQLAALQYCADRRAELALEVVARKGRGFAKVARFRATQALVGGVRALWLGEPSPSERAWQPAASDKAVPVTKDEASARAAAESRVPLPKPHAKGAPGERIALRQGQLVELAPRAPIASCERWQIELEPGLSRATLRIEDARGELLGEADSDHMRACVAVCAPHSVRRPSLVGRTGFGVLTLRVEPAHAHARAQPDCTSSGRRW